MTNKKGKRAVIINNIKSESIEQAIFILKSDMGEKYSEAGSMIIAEAQEIINNYINRVERLMPRPVSKKKKIIYATVGAVLAIAISIGTAFLLSYY